MRCLPVLLIPAWTAAVLFGQPAADRKAEIAASLQQKVLEPGQIMKELREGLDPRVPRMPDVSRAEEWERIAAKIREEVLDNVVFCGEAAKWRTLKTNAIMLDTIKGGEGYCIRKLRFEAVPGLWIPGLLYEPEKLEGKVPVMLAVNGHDGNGKAAGYKQIRCINLAKRGMLVLNLEWVGMGQLRTDGFRHYRMNQLDLCGTSGLAVFYLNMQRGLDILLSHPHADPQRVAVSGLSGGAWQTIILSSLDTRVTLCNPVAGYSSYRTRLQYLKDLGDSEQTPVDLARYADYTHLTAMLAPRAALLTYNAKDNCCFEAGYALPPLMAAAEPIYKLYGKPDGIRSHVNYDPGTHNYERENREQLYKMIGDFFYPTDKAFNPKEIPCDKEVKSREELHVPLPDRNEDFNTLALALSKSLPRQPDVPMTLWAHWAWAAERRDRLAAILRVKPGPFEASWGAPDRDDAARFKLAGYPTFPASVFPAAKPKGVTVVISDTGRVSAVEQVQRLLADGQTVVAADLFYFGESHIPSHNFLFGLFVSCVGDRPLGVQARQLEGLARAAAQRFQKPVSVVAIGPRSSLIALSAAALHPEHIAGLELHGSLGSLKEIIELNRGVDQMPEMFCFGLLEQFDVKQLAALVVPRPVRFASPSPRAKEELGGLGKLYQALGSSTDPLK